MRLFIGIGLDYDVREYLKSVQTVVKQTAYQGNFTDFDNFHITVKFLGEIKAEEVSMVEEVLEEAVNDLSVFEIKIGDIGFFRRGRSKLIFVKVTEGINQLNTLHQRVERYFKAENFEASHKFTPHITIARQVLFKDNHGASLLMPHYCPKVRIDTVTLFQSSRILGKLTYTPLYHVKLR